jgi:hypothetical protein
MAKAKRGLKPGLYASCDSAAALRRHSVADNGLAAIARVPGRIDKRLQTSRALENALGQITVHGSNLLGGWLLASGYLTANPPWVPAPGATPHPLLLDGRDRRNDCREARCRLAAVGRKPTDIFGSSLRRTDVQFADQRRDFAQSRPFLALSPPISARLASRPAPRNRCSYRGRDRCKARNGPTPAIGTKVIADC